MTKLPDNLISEILKSIRTIDVEGVDMAGVRNLFDIEALRKTV